ncbi:MAG: hypothetical protein AB7G47_04130 [Mycolicibacterium sp.]|uniref:hypothetical protein n=1 Tax=Mycolicibacterium sp. TaxID=2320850 RepID=UPI003D0D3EBF
MPAAIRSYVTAGVALVGASVISVTPVVPNLAAAQQEVRTVRMDVDLTAQSAANIVPNLINMFLNMPMANVNAVNYFAETWSLSGNWWVYSQDNILGWDRRNPAMAWSFADLLLPIPALSKPYGEAMQWWMAANLPQHQGCSGLPPCPEYNSMFASMFRVPGWEFYDEDGYTFGPDGYTPQYDQVSENEHYWGYELGEEGDQIEWWGQTVKLDPFAGWKSLINYLLEDPEPVRFPTLQETFEAWAKFGETLSIMFNPFVPQSYIWNPRYSASAYLLRPFAPYLCPQCNTYDPFMPPDWVPEDGFPKPVNDGWQDDDAETPTGLPLPTTSETSDAALLRVSVEGTDEGPVESATVDAESTGGEAIDSAEEASGAGPGEEQDANTATETTDVSDTESTEAAGEGTGASDSGDGDAVAEDEGLAGIETESSQPGESEDSTSNDAEGSAGTDDSDSADSGNTEGTE